MQSTGDGKAETFALPVWRDARMDEANYAALLLNAVEALTKEVASMRGEIEASKTFIEKIQGEIGPVLDMLQNNPMFKMLFKGK